MSATGAHSATLTTRTMRTRGKDDDGGTKVRGCACTPAPSRAHTRTACRPAPLPQPPCVGPRGRTLARTCARVQRAGRGQRGHGGEPRERAAPAAPRLRALPRGPRHAGGGRSVVVIVRRPRQPVSAQGRRRQRGGLDAAPTPSPSGAAALAPPPPPQAAAARSPLLPRADGLCAPLALYGGLRGSGGGGAGVRTLPLLRGCPEGAWGSAPPRSLRGPRRRMPPPRRGRGGGTLRGRGRGRRAAVAGGAQRWGQQDVR